jgi:hypothetical protein
VDQPSAPAEQPAPQPYQPYGAQSQQGQPHPGQPQPGQPQQGQPQPGQPQPGQPQQGQPQPGQPYGAQPQPNPYAPAPGAKRGIKPWVWWVIGGAAAFVVLVVVGIILLFTVILGGNGAKSVAQDYLNDIAKGNATAANKLARIDTDEDANRLLTDDVLGEAEHITNPVVSRTINSRSSDLTQASVTYKLNGKSYRGTIELDKDDKGWYVSRGLTYQLPFVSSSIPGYSVPGAEASITSRDSDLIAYPGVYTVQAPNKYYDIKGEPKLTVAADSYELKSLELTPSAAYLTEVQKQVDAHYAACAKQTNFYDVEDCGIELSYPANLSTSKSTVAVKVDESPKVTVGDKDSLYEFEIGPGKFSAVMTGTDYSGNPGTENLTGEAGYISADIKIADDKVEVTFN